MNPTTSSRRILHLGLAVVVTWLTSITMAMAARFTSSAEQEEYVRKTLEAQADQMRAGEERARREYIGQLMTLFRETGRLAFLLEGTRMFTAEEAVSRLPALLTHTNPEARLVVLDGLARHGTNALPALALIVTRLEDADERVVQRAAQTLGGFGPAGIPAAPELLRVLGTTNRPPGVREEAAMALSRIGPAAEAALAVLDQFAEDADAGVARAALLAAGAIRREPALSCNELRARGPEVFATRDALRALQGARAASCSPAESAVLLTGLLATGARPALRMEACEILGHLAVETGPVAEVLLIAAADSDPRIATAAASALSRLPATNLAIVPLLTDAAAGPADLPAVTSARLLARFGPAAGPAAPVLMRSLQRFHGTKHYERTLACLAALRAAGTNAAPARADLESCLAETAVIYQGLWSHEAKVVRAAVLVALAEIGPTSDTMPAVVDELANASESLLRAAAARAAGALPEGRERVVPLLRDLLAQPDLDFAVDLEELNDHAFSPKRNPTSVYLEAIRALRRFGKEAGPALSVLRQRAQDPLRRSRFFPAYQHEAAELVALLSRSR